jgi:beta-glucanase (GH16 family)
MAGAIRFMLGFYPKTEAIELKEQVLLNEYKKLKDIESCDELTRYYFLEKTTLSQEFINKRRELENLTYKGSEDHLKEEEYLRLKKLSDIKFFYKYKNSSELTEFLQTEKSKELHEYNNLKQFLQSESYKKIFDYMNDKKKFEKTPEYHQLQEYKSISENTNFRNYFNFIKNRKYSDFESLQHSAELEEFIKLEKYLQSKEFIQIKNGPKKVFKKSEAAAKLKEYQITRKSNKYKNYFKLHNSTEFSDYKKVHNSEELKYFLELQKIVESETFKNKRKQIESQRFDETQEFQKLQQFKTLEKSALIKKYFKVVNSKQLAHYKNLENSKEISHYEKLEKYILSEPFINSKNYLLDPKKWEKTEDFKLFQEFNQLKKDPTLLWYFKNKDLAKYSELKAVKLVFEDHFDQGALDQEKWISRYFWGEMILGESYALPGEKHLFTDKNIELNGSTIKLVTKQGKISGKEWHPAYGFYPKDFEYSSGLISTGKSHRQKYGRIKAKIKIPASQGLLHAFWLSGNTMLPQIDIFKYNNQKLFFNNFWGNPADPGNINKDISSISSSVFTKGFFIYSLEWTPDKLIWKINDLVVKIQTVGVPEEPLYIVLNSGKVDGTTENLPVKLEIDWIRCYEWV